MTTVNTNQSSFYLPATVCFNDSCNTLANIPWVPDLVNAGTDIAGAAVLTQDKGNFAAGVYVEAERHVWRLAMTFQDLHRYVIAKDAALKLVHRQGAPNSEDTATQVFKNGKLQTTKEVGSGAYDVYAIVTAAAGGSSTPAVDTTAVVAPGTNVSVTTSVSGNTTTYTVNATGGSVVEIADTAAAGNLVATITIDGTDTAINETVTSIGAPTWDSVSGAFALTYTDEEGTVNTESCTILPTFVNTDNQQLTGDTTGSVSFTLTPVVVSGVTNYTLKGDVLVDGTTITIDPTTHKLSAVGGSSGSETTTTVTNTVTGHKIGTYTNEVNATVDINETTTTLTGALTTGHTIGTYTNEVGTATVLKETTTSLALTGAVLTYTDEAGTATALTLPTGAPSISTLTAYNAASTNAASGQTITVGGVVTLGTTEDVSGTAITADANNTIKLAAGGVYDVKFYGNCSFGAAANYLHFQVATGTTNASASHTPGGAKAQFLPVTNTNSQATNSVASRLVVATVDTYVSVQCVLSSGTGNTVYSSKLQIMRVGNI